MSLMTKGSKIFTECEIILELDKLNISRKH